MTVKLYDYEELMDDNDVLTGCKADAMMYMDKNYDLDKTLSFDASVIEALQSEKKIPLFDCYGNFVCEIERTKWEKYKSEPPLVYICKSFIEELKKKFEIGSRYSLQDAVNECVSTYIDM